MNKNELIYADVKLRQVLEKTDFVAQTCQQINKDLGGLAEGELTTNGLNLSGQTPLDFLLDQLDHILENMKSGNKAQFLYRVDISEHVFNELLAIGNERELAFRILKREAQKVFFKNHFKV